MMETMTDVNLPSTQDELERAASGASDAAVEAKRALLAGLIGGVVATAGYFLYSRLEDEQKENIRRTVTKFVEEKVAEVKAQLKI